MKTLAIEFSSDWRGVALAEGNHVIGSAFETVGRETHPFALITRALAQAGWSRAEIQRVVVGLGPGSYNGIRTAIAVAQGWQLARGTELGGLSSVAALAEELRGQGVTGSVELAVDAQRGEFYLAGYKLRSDGIEQVSSLRIVARSEVESAVAAGRQVCGPGGEGLPSGAREVFPTASALARLAVECFAACAAEALEPIYLRETNFLKAPSPRVVV